MMKSKYFFVALLLILLLPLLWIDINAFHNWGDDFAQYLCNARHMLQSDDTRMYHAGAVAPLHRGAGFSMILGVWMSIFDLQLPAYFLLISLCLIFCAFVLYRFFQNFLPATPHHLTVLVLVLLFVYNRHVLFLKTEILPVFLLIALCYACLLLYQNVTSKSIPLAILCLGFLLSIANVAWVMYLSLFLARLIQIRRQHEKHNWRITALLFLLPLLVFGVIKIIVFKTLLTDELAWYLPVFGHQSLPALIQNNLVYYKDIFFVTFDQDVWFVLNKANKVLVMCLLLPGIYLKWRKGPAAEDLFFVCYILVLLVYPDQGGGMRLWLPLLPMVFLYATYTCMHILMWRRFSTNVVPLFFLPFIFTQGQTLQANIKEYAREADGPYSAAAKACFQFINDSTEKNCAVAFVKPWTIMLYGKRSAMPFPNTQSLTALKRLMVSNGVQYVLCDIQSQWPEMRNDQTYHEILGDPQFRCVYRQPRFVLFRLVNGS